jgi:hypothetical protein
MLSSIALALVCASADPSWTDPVVIAYDPMTPSDREPQHRLAYPYVYEHKPGELWVTAMQGPVRIKLSEGDPVPRPQSDTTYSVRYVPKAKIAIDGNSDEPEWSQAVVLKDFAFPWKQITAPSTELRALCDDENFYFSFRVEDADIVTLETLRDKQDIVFEDRVELFFAPDDQMKEYYCIEVDALGRAYDYRAEYYRQFHPDWTLKGLETKGTLFGNGYTVEGRIPLATFEELGFPRLRPGAKFHCGAYRAEFSHDRSDTALNKPKSPHTGDRRLDIPPPIEAWISWIDPKTETPDFHVPTSLGWFEIVR